MNQPATPKAPIKILYCIDNLLRGGTELQLTGLIERLDPREYQPYLLTIRPSDPVLTPANCTHLAWHVPKLFSPQGLLAVFKLVRFLRREKISIVQTFFQDSTVFGGLAAWLARTPVRIACFRDLGFWHTKKQALVLAKIYGLMTGFICNAEIVKDHFVKLFKLKPEKLQLLRNGIDVKALPFVPHEQACRHVGIVGNMTRQVKRTDLFIKAAGIVAKNHPEITWHILGDGHLRGELEQLAKERGVFDKIHFAGRVSAVAEYLEQLDIGIICSDSEGLSNALLEYMFKGVASVATRVGGNPELVHHGKSGLLVPPDNEEALAAAITTLVEDNDLRISLALQARAQVEQEYSWDICIARHNDFYRSSLAAAQHA
jgi:L-malate glycosyltransferase